MEKIKDSFLRVKKDIKTLSNVVLKTKDDLDKTRVELLKLCDIVSEIDMKSTVIATDNESINKDMVKILNKLDILLRLNKNLSIDISNKTKKGKMETDYFNFKTIRHTIKPRKDEYLGISIGNEGDKTNRQTDKQTNRQGVKSSYNQYEANLYEDGGPQDKDRENIDNAVDMLNSLDSIKKEIRLKFKRLTRQEMLVFSTIYQLEEEIGGANYKTIAQKINLTESSIRDYVRRLIAKGIPIVKEKLNNKEIKIYISKNLKKIATLSSILELRNI